MEKTQIEKMTDIDKSKIDGREYLGLYLKNQIKVLLISDQEATSGTACININVGAKDDPNEHPGLSHLCEHMLARGTEKYPKQDDFAYSIVGCQSGLGCRSATSYLENVIFKFQVDSRDFENVLDRLSQYFISPLFDQKHIDEEVEKIQNEFDDLNQRRSDVYQLVDKNTCDQLNDYRKFECGNKKTLSAKNLREKLIKFFNDRYSANLMTLCLESKLSLEESQKLVEKLFGSIKNKNLKPVHNLRNNAFTKNHLQKLIRISLEPKSDGGVLLINFNIQDPKLINYIDFIKFLILSNSRNPSPVGSVSYECKNKGWVDRQSDTVGLFPEYFACFVLTESGVNNVDSVVRVVFQYLELIKTKSDQWSKHFDQFKQMESLLFHYEDKNSPRYPPFTRVEEIACRLQTIGFKSVLKKCQTADKFDSKVFRELLNEFKPENLRITVEASKFIGKTDQKDKYHEINFAYEEIPKKWVDSFREPGPNSNLRLPDMNPFIPTDLSLVEREKEAFSIPQLVRTDEFFNIWYFQDLTDSMPKAQVAIHLINPIVFLDPVSLRCMQIYRRLISESLKDLRTLTDSGLDYEINIDTSNDGLLIEIFGWTHKMLIILESVLDSIASLKTDCPKNESKIKESKQSDLQMLAGGFERKDHLKFILKENEFSDEEMKAAWNQVTVERLDEVVRVFLRSFFVQVYAEGNVIKETAESIATLVKSKLINEKTRPVSKTLILTPKRCLKLKTNLCYALHVVEKLAETSDPTDNFQPAVNRNILTCHYQYKQIESALESCSVNILRQVIGAILQQKTENKTDIVPGYVMPRRIRGVETISLELVSSTESFNYLDEFVESVVQDLRENIVKMADADFQSILDPLKLTATDRRHRIEFTQEIVRQRNNFLRRFDEQSILSKIKKSDLLDIYDEIFLKSRRKLLILTTMTKNSNEVPVPPKNALPIKDIVRFKERLEAFPVVRYTFEEISKKFSAKSKRGSIRGSN